MKIIFDFEDMQNLDKLSETVFLYLKDDWHSKNPFHTQETENEIDGFFKKHLPEIEADSDEQLDVLGDLYPIIEKVRKIAFSVGFKTAMVLSEQKIK